MKKKTLALFNSNIKNGMKSNRFVREVENN